MRLEDLKELYTQYRVAVSEWAQKSGPELDELIREAGAQDGAVAMEVLEALPSRVLTGVQLDELFQSLSFWLQGTSKLYGSALRVMVRHSRALLPQIERGFVDACMSGDDSLVRGLCHALSPLDLEAQQSMKGAVVRGFGSSNPHVQEAIRDLAERARVFEVPQRGPK